MIKLSQAMQGALRSAGASDDASDQAAEAVAEIDETLHQIITELRVIQERMSSIDRRLDVHQWLFGAVILGMLFMIIRSFV